MSAESGRSKVMRKTIEERYLESVVHDAALILAKGKPALADEWLSQPDFRLAIEASFYAGRYFEQDT